MTTTRHRFPLPVYRAILRRQRNRCACGCRKKFDGIRDINWDHITALADGGTDTPDNLQALKLRHHKKKTKREGKARAKVKRIQETDGLRKKKLSRREKVMADYLGVGQAP